MSCPTISVNIFRLLLAGSLLSLTAATLPSSQPQRITPSPAGPFHVSGNTIVDSHDRAFLMRGTQLTEFHPQNVALDNRAAKDFGPHSATTLTAVRLRFNMNTVRLPLNVLEASAPNYFDGLSKVVRRANRADLLVVLAAREPGAGLPSAKTAEFWSRCAAIFKNDPNVMFDVFSEPSSTAIPDPHSTAGWNRWRDSMQGLVHAVRAAGATQPVVVTAWKDDRLFEGAGSGAMIDDPNIVYEASLRIAKTQTDAQRSQYFASLSARVPVLANGWDLELDDAAACAAIPSDPSAAAALVKGNLDFFDAHNVSWTVSVMEPGKLINDLTYHDATSLENGWTCGRPVYPFAGLGRVVEGHLRNSDERGLFVVSASGGPDLARGGMSIAYGPILAARDAKIAGVRASVSLGGISVQVTDSSGVTRPAGMVWASAGWGQTNFVIPQDSAVGPAMMTIVRDDGSRISGNIMIADTAPGFQTGLSCSGPAVGEVIKVSRSGRTSTTAVSSCTGTTSCQTIPIPMVSGAAIKVKLLASGFRNARSVKDISATIDGVPVPVISYGPGKEPGLDYLTVTIPDGLRGLGETDLISYVNGRPSNAVRINLGGEKPAI